MQTHLFRWADEQCYGLMHMRANQNPNTYFGPDSVEHFKQGIASLIQLTTDITSKLSSFTVVEQTRGGIAAYDAGTSVIGDRSMFNFSVEYSTILSFRVY